MLYRQNFLFLNYYKLAWFHKHKEAVLLKLLLLCFRLKNVNKNHFKYQKWVNFVFKCLVSKEYNLKWKRILDVRRIEIKTIWYAKTSSWQSQAVKIRTKPKSVIFNYIFYLKLQFDIGINGQLTRLMRVSQKSCINNVKTILLQLFFKR